MVYICGVCLDKDGEPFATMDPQEFNDHIIKDHVNKYYEEIGLNPKRS